MTNTGIEVRRDGASQDAIATPVGVRWYAAGVFAGRENIAEQHLQRQGFTSFVPRAAKTIRHARRTYTRTAAYFPGYMFVALDVTQQRWRAVNGTIGVRSLIMRGDRPSPV
ncbi:MAG: hypothetical protein E5W41_02215, partial [Mesorhizobium sp.]